MRELCAQEAIVTIQVLRSLFPKKNKQMVQVGLERYATACVRRSSLFNYKMFLNRQRTQLSQFRFNKKKQNYFNLSRAGLEVNWRTTALPVCTKGSGGSKQHAVSGAKCSSVFTSTSSTLSSKSKQSVQGQRFLPPRSVFGRIVWGMVAEASLQQ